MIGFNKICSFFLPECQEEELKGVTLLVLANKQDLPGALSAAEVRNTKRLGGQLDRSEWNLMMMMMMIHHDAAAAAAAWSITIGVFLFFDLCLVIHGEMFLRQLNFFWSPSISTYLSCQNDGASTLLASGYTSLRKTMAPENRPNHTPKRKPDLNQPTPSIFRCEHGCGWTSLISGRVASHVPLNVFPPPEGVWIFGPHCYPKPAMGHLSDATRIPRWNAFLGCV